MDKDLLTEAYTIMKTIRRFEETLSVLFAENSSEVHSLVDRSRGGSCRRWFSDGAAG